LDAVNEEAGASPGIACGLGDGRGWSWITIKIGRPVATADCVGRASNLSRNERCEAEDAADNWEKGWKLHVERLFGVDSDEMWRGWMGVEVLKMLLDAEGKVWWLMINSK
jgi:hypothetical protein